MIKFYQYIYYRIYKWNLRNSGINDLPQYNAMFGLSFLIFFNIYIVPELIQSLTGFWISFEKDEYKIVVAIFAVIIFIINYFAFVKNRKYLKLVEKFKDETPAESRRGTIMIIVYIFLSFLTPIIIAIISHC